MVSEQMNYNEKHRVYIFIFFFASNIGAQDTLNTPVSIGNISFDYLKPQEYDIGPIRVVGADNYDHQAIKLIAGLKQGQSVKVPRKQFLIRLKIYGMKESFLTLK